MEQKKHWWQNQPLTISAAQVHISDTDDFVLEEYVAKSGFNVEQNLHLFAKDNMPTEEDLAELRAGGKPKIYTTAMGYYREAEDGEKLDRYLKKSRKLGIREIIYYNTHCISDAIAQKHPTWVQKTREGKNIKAYTVYNYVCVNPEGDRHADVLREIAALAKHDIDGIFIDGPAMMDTGCYCDVCRRSFRRMFGHEMEEGTDAQRLALRSSIVAAHIRQIRETAKAINPEICVYCNNAALRADVTGSNTRAIAPYVDMLGSEGGFHPAPNGYTRWMVGSYTKYLACVAGDTLTGEKPLVSFFCGNQQAIAYYMHTPAETVFTYADACANGANVWYGVHFSVSEFMDTEASRTAADLNRFLLANSDCFGPSRACSRVALVWSQPTANSYNSSVNDSDFTGERIASLKERGDHAVAIQSVYDMLVKAHVQFDIIDEVSLTDGTLGKYEAAIFPEVACLSDDALCAVKDYVRAGGKILANFDFGLYGEDGAPADPERVNDLFGFTGKPTVSAAQSMGHVFMFREKECPITDALSFFRIPGAPLNMHRASADPEDVLMSICADMDSRYQTIPYERFPGIVRHPFGKGAAYYHCGNYPEAAAKVRNIPDIPAIVRAFCEENAAPTVETRHAGTYEAVLRRTKDKYVLHLVNATGERPFTEPVPLYNVNVTCHLDGFGLDLERPTPRTLRGGKLADVKTEKNKITFTLDVLTDWEVIAIEE